MWFERFFGNRNFEQYFVEDEEKDKFRLRTVIANEDRRLVEIPGAHKWDRCQAIRFAALCKKRSVPTAKERKENVLVEFVHIKL